MADAKISQLTAATTPLAGTEVLPIVQSGSTVKVAVSNLTAGRAVSMASGAISGDLTVDTNTLYVDSTNNGVGIGTTSLTGYLANKLVIDTSTDSNNGIVIKSATDRNGSIWFADGTGANAYRGGIDYNHTQDTLYFYGAGQGNLNLDSSGNFSVVAGNLVIGTSGKGIDFSADGQAAGMTSELLDDYEEGAFTPTLITDGTDFTSVTYDGGVGGFYTKIGRVVTFQLYMRTDAVTIGSASGNVLIGGLPFTSSAPATNVSATALVGYQYSWASNGPFSALINNNATTMYLAYRSGGGQTDLVQVASVGTGAANNITRISGSYLVA